MRWKLCKIYQKPVDDPMFEQINTQQALWYQMQMSLDVKEQFEILRDVAEHNAMFTNPEGVKKIREARENTYETSDEEFDDLLEGMFGRTITKDDDSKDAIEFLKKKRESNCPSVMDLDLDDISFTPFK